MIKVNDSKILQLREHITWLSLGLKSGKYFCSYQLGIVIAVLKTLGFES
jgi:hypothetical protein